MANKTSKPSRQVRNPILRPPPAPLPLVFKCIPTKELKVDAGDGYTLFKSTPPQILQAVEEGARKYLAGKKCAGLRLQRVQKTF